MPLLLTRSDLRPLAADDEALDGAIAAVEASVLRSHDGDRGQAVFAGLRLPNGDELAAMFVARETGPASFRIFPNKVRGTRRNAWVGIQVSGSTGEIECMIALDDLNALRTSVPAAAGVRHLAPDGAATLAVLGSGAQARSHVRTIARVMPGLKAIRVWSPTKDHREDFARQVAERSKATVTASGSLDTAVDGADVITAAGQYQAGQPALPDPAAVRPGALVVSMTGAAMNLLPRGARLAVPTAQRPELVAGGFSSGFLRGGPPPMPPEPLELADVITGKVPARRSPSQTLVFELGAPYLWDLPILTWIRDWAASRELGLDIDLSA
jgi:alanine dehydrogenase